MTTDHDMTTTTSRTGMYQQIARNKRLSVLYVLLFLVLWIAVGALVGWIFAALTTSNVGSASAGPGGTATTGGADVLSGAVIAAVLAVAATVFALRSGSRMVLRIAGARPADPMRYVQVHNLVEVLALGDGLPTPAVYIIDDPAPNAFATGTSPAHAAVTVTTGLLETMNREELEGVLAHEMSHIKNYDVRLLLIVSTLIGMAGLLAGLAWRSAYFTRGRGRTGGQAAIVVLAAAALLGLVAAVLGPVVRLALSRRRESLADISGVELTRNPAGLIHALEKLEDNGRPLASSSTATAAMCIDDPRRGRSGWLHRLSDTHPTLESRIAALQQLTAGTPV
jgi:heat shock protein HtpX